MTATLSHAHRFEPATTTTDAGAVPLLLLHGTGGDEHDLVPLGAVLSPGGALLSPRGQVLENGMPRFFRRLAEGVFDEADVVRRAGELADFVAAARRAYGLPAPVAVGFSNGANIAAATLVLRPETLAGAVLIRPMPPLAVLPEAGLAGLPVLILSGAMDPIAPVEGARRLAAELAERGAAVEHQTLPAGHGLSQADIRLAKEWIAARRTAADDAGVIPTGRASSPTG